MRCARLQCTSLNLGKFQSCVSTFKFGPSFASAQLARALRSFLSRLPPVLAGGSTVKSSSPNKSWSRIPVNRGRDPSLADSESLRAVQQRLGQQSVLAAGLPVTGRECFTSNSQPTCAFKVCLLQSQHGHPGNSSRCPDQ
jgi:hypothetical protein